MRVALFVPCYVDQFYPKVAVHTLELLEKLGCEVAYPENQTCCGQPMANAGFEKVSGPVVSLFERTFQDFDFVVCPSGSCTLHILEHHPSEHHRQERRVFELCEFLVDVLHVDSLTASFPYRVGLHASCHGQRGLGLSTATEREVPPYDKVRKLLEMVEGVEIVPLERSDECCGFGGTFAVTEQAISVRMGEDRLEDHLKNKAEFVTGTDMSCLMHLGGIIGRKQLPLQAVHIAEILNASGKLPQEVRK